MPVTCALKTFCSKFKTSISSALWEETQYLEHSGMDLYDLRVLSYHSVNNLNISICDPMNLNEHTRFNHSNELVIWSQKYELLLCYTLWNIAELNTWQKHTYGKLQCKHMHSHTNIHIEMQFSTSCFGCIRLIRFYLFCVLLCCSHFFYVFTRSL